LPDPDRPAPLAAPLTLFEYDIMGRTVSTTDALDRETTYLYDATGRLIEQTDARGTTKYDYDRLDRVIRTSEAGPLCPVLPALCVGWCMLWNAVASLASDSDFILPEMKVPPGEWLIRVDKTGHEPTLRIQLRANGQLEVFRGREATAEWRQVYAATVPDHDLREAYEAARTLVRNLRLQDRSRPVSVRDDSSACKVTLATARSASQISFKPDEQIRDKLLTNDLTQLFVVLRRNLPKGRGVGLNLPQYWPSLDR
jgi:YD repeat-containing protein